MSSAEPIGVCKLRTICAETQDEMLGLVANELALEPKRAKCARCGRDEFIAHLYRLKNAELAYCSDKCEQDKDLPPPEIFRCHHCGDPIDPMRMMFSRSPPGKYTIYRAMCSPRCLDRYYRRIDAAAQPAAEITHLCTCGEPAKSKCGRCRMVRYCSRKCQREDWPRHKSLCKNVTGGA